MRSAFESWLPAGSPRSSSGGSLSAGYEEDEATKRVRIVGFPESPNVQMQPNDLARFASCSLDERPKRQSSLAQQLALKAFEAEQKPKLRAINTKPKTNSMVTRRANSTVATGLGAHQRQHSTLNVHIGDTINTTTDNNRTSFEFPSTLPSGQGSGYNPIYNHLNRNSSGSEAVPIPQGLTKAYTAPQPLPELSELSGLPPSLVAIIQGSNTSGKSSAKPQPQTGGAAARRSSASRLLPSPVSSQHSPPTAMPPHSSSASSSATAAYFSSKAAAERGALAQVAGLKEALRQEQEEVARLQLELAKLAMQQQASRQQQQRCGSADVQMTPVTPDAADEHHQGQHHHQSKSMSSDDLDSHFEGFNANGVAAPTQHHHWNYDTRGRRAWCG